MDAVREPDGSGMDALATPGNRPQSTEPSFSGNGRCGSRNPIRTGANRVPWGSGRAFGGSHADAQSGHLMQACRRSEADDVFAGDDL